MEHENVSIGQHRNRNRGSDVRLWGDLQWVSLLWGRGGLVHIRSTLLCADMCIGTLRAEMTGFPLLSEVMLTRSAWHRAQVELGLGCI